MGWLGLWPTASESSTLLLCNSQNLHNPKKITLAHIANISGGSKSANIMALTRQRCLLKLCGGRLNGFTIKTTRLNNKVQQKRQGLKPSHYSPGQREHSHLGVRLTARCFSKLSPTCKSLSNIHSRQASCSTTSASVTDSRPPETKTVYLASI